MAKVRVAWSGMEKVQGNMDAKLRLNLRQLLDEFGIILENEARQHDVNVYLFPVFKEFNLLAALTTTSIVFFISYSNSAFPQVYWYDWRAEKVPPDIDKLASFLEHRYDWTVVNILTFSLNILDQGSIIRSVELRLAATEWVKGAIAESERKARIVRFNPMFKGRDFLVENDLCFVIMPFSELHLQLYADHIKPILEQNGLRVMKADDIFKSTPIMEDIWALINKARLIVSDVTGKNPNVFYELGIAHTVGKEVIILSQNTKDIPFDLRHLRCFNYDTSYEGFQRLRQNIQNAVSTIVTNK